MAERDQLVACLPALEGKAAKEGEHKAQLQQSEQEMVTHGQEAFQLHAQLQDAKVRWTELQDTVLVAAEHEFAYVEQVNNLEEALTSKQKRPMPLKRRRSRWMIYLI